VKDGREQPLISVPECSFGFSDVGAAHKRGKREAESENDREPDQPMGTSVEDCWRESSRPELWAVWLQRPVDDRPARAGHPHALPVRPAVQLAAV
jgi:hypothetical protein